jgi:hypothetical protein
LRGAIEENTLGAPSLVAAPLLLAPRIARPRGTADLRVLQARSAQLASHRLGMSRTSLFSGGHTTPAYGSPLRSDAMVWARGTAYSVQRA